MIPVDLRIRIDAEAVNVVIMKKKAEHCLIVESCQCSNNDKRGNVMIDKYLFNQDLILS